MQENWRGLHVTMVGIIAAKSTKRWLIIEEARIVIDDGHSIMTIIVSDLPAVEQAHTDSDDDVCRKPQKSQHLHNNVKRNRMNQ